MNFQIKGMQSIRLLILMFCLNACGETSTKFSVTENRLKNTAKAVFFTGYQKITERYIESTSPSKFTIEGLQGLGAIDPSVTIESVNGVIILRVNNRIVGRLDKPQIDDAANWANLTVRLTELGRKKSAELKRATPEKIYEAIFDSILSKLDIYSRYSGFIEAKQNREKRNGFFGIGVNFQITKNLPQIISIAPNSPAFLAGLREGDWITKIDDLTVEGLKHEQIKEKLRGPEKTVLTLYVNRKEQEKKIFKIERSYVATKTVVYDYKKDIILIKVKKFNKHTVANIQNILKNAQIELGSNIKGIILDLRGNPGGLLKQSIKVADLFLTQGRLSETRGRHPDSLQFYRAGGRDMANGRPIVVLVDGKSASAAEVTAAALQDRGRAIIVGTSSFGKGTVQTIIDLPNKGEITLTWSHLITPSGYTLHGLGVYPMVCTSGFDENKDDGGAVLEKAQAERIKTTAILKAWRNTNYSDKKKRNELRSFCPPEQRKVDLDNKVAVAILEDKNFYTRTLKVLTAAQ